MSGHSTHQEVSDGPPRQGLDDHGQPTGTKVVATKPMGGWRGLDAVADEVKKAGRRALSALVDIAARSLGSTRPCVVPVIQ